MQNSRIPRGYIPAVQHAIEVESRQGHVAGYEVLDLKARLIDGKYHDADSSALAFEIARRACFREAQKLSKPKLLKPIMSLEVVTEATYLAVVRRLKTGTGVNLQKPSQIVLFPVAPHCESWHIPFWF
nr:hypothetical protein [Rhodanobacter sp. MP1X3]